MDKGLQRPFTQEAIQMAIGCLKKKMLRILMTHWGDAS